MSCPGYRRAAHQAAALIPAATGRSLRLCRWCALRFSTDVLEVAAGQEPT
jgi:hypothetical protein